MVGRLLIVIALVASAVGSCQSVPTASPAGQRSSAAQQWAELNQRATEAYEQRRYAEALRLDQQAYDLALEAFGPKDPDTLISLNNLAGVYVSQGRLGKAETLYAQTLQLRREVLGERHPETLQSLNNLAMLYHRRGRYGEAAPLWPKFNSDF